MINELITLQINPEDDSFNKAKEEFIKQERERLTLTQYRKLQSLIRKVGESRGFQASINEKIANDNKWVDVLLQNETQTIAIKVAVHTSAEKDVLSIQKFLDNKYSLIISCSQDKMYLQKIQDLATKEIPVKYLRKVLFFSIQELCLFLDREHAKRLSGEKWIKGNRVKVNYIPVGPEESIKRRKHLAKIITDPIGRRKISHTELS